jgi:hypothetical protein
MSDLFDQQFQQDIKRNAPLADPAPKPAIKFN